ncbi:COP9 signalosome complex subunit 3 [Citrus sinensis]|nr:COP9 signalosome complex subunit 3 [Citrus sinensis]
MQSIENLVTQIQGLSSNASDITALKDYLKAGEDLLRSESTRLLSFLDQLDPSKHSLVINVCKRYKDQVLLLEAPIRGVGPMLTAIRKIQSSTEHLTTLHPEFLQLCLLAKCYKAGLSVLEDDIYEINLPRDFFLYCYYGFSSGRSSNIGLAGISYMEHLLVKWDDIHRAKALSESFGASTQCASLCYMQFAHNCSSLNIVGVIEQILISLVVFQVVTAPMSSINAIAVEAYKKYILVSLIHHGQFSSTLPKYTSSAAQRNLKNFSQPYMELVNTYNTGKIVELETYVQTNREKFESDNNLGLVKQVVSSMYKRNIQRLTQTYLTLSLQDIANTVQLNSSKEAEMHVLQMFQIQDGEIFATINQKDGMVRFLEDPEQYKTCEMIEHIDSSIQRIMSLSKKLTAMDELISCDPLYLGKAGRERQRFDFDDFDSVPQKFNI